MATNFQLEARIQQLELLVRSLRDEDDPLPDIPEWQRRTQHHEDDFPPTSDGGRTGTGGADPRLPDPTFEGHQLLSLDGSNWVPRLPITNEWGWMVNDQGQLLVA